MKIRDITPRQREILTLIAAGLTSIQIADRLNLSHKTVETHRNEMMGRLGIHNLAGLVRYAIDQGFAEAVDKAREKNLPHEMGGFTSETEQHKTPDFTDAMFTALTSRELELARLVASGLSNRETAKAMGITPKTAENHRLRVMRKLKLKNAVALCRRAIRCGLIEA